MKKIVIFLFLLGNTFCKGTSIKVVRVIDGDTFETVDGEKVRLIGINAPEIKDIFGAESAQYLKILIENKIVDLQKDSYSNDRDRYQRLLRYVYIEELDINKKMVNDGFAFAYLKYHFEKEKDYKETQLAAQNNDVGIWRNSNKEKILNQQKDITETSFYSKSNIRKWLIAFLLLVLVFIGGEVC